MRSFVTKVRGFFKGRPTEHVGVLIDDHMLRYVVTKKKDNLRLVPNHGSINIPDGIIKHGSIQQMEGFKTVLRRLKSEVGSRPLRLGLPLECMGSRVLRIPVVDLNQNTGKETLPEQIQSEIVAHFYNKEGKSDVHFNFNHTVLHVSPSVVTVKVDHIKEKDYVLYRHAFKKAGFTVDSYQSAMEVYSRLAPFFKGGRPHAVAHISKHRSEFAIIQSGYVVQHHVSRKGVYSGVIGADNTPDQINVLLRPLTSMIADWNNPRYRPAWKQDQITSCVVVGEGGLMHDVRMQISNKTGCSSIPGSLITLDFDASQSLPSVSKQEVPAFDLPYALSL